MILSQTVKSMPSLPRTSSLLVFPLAALFNTYSMTGLLLVFGIAGDAETAADIGLVQAATLALFFAFSANARNLVLADDSGQAAADLLRMRLFLMLPLAVAAWLLSVSIGNATGLLAGVLVLRRLGEWMGEIGLALWEREGKIARARRSLFFEVSSLGVACLLPFITSLPLAMCFLPWALAPLIATPFGLRARSLHRLAWKALLPHFGSTVAIGTSTYVFRISIAILAGKAFAGELFTAFALGGLLPTLFGSALAPSLARRYRDQVWPRKMLVVPLLVFSVAAVLAALLRFHVVPSIWLNHSTEFWTSTALSIAGGAIMLIALVLRTRLIQRMEGPQVYGADLLANVIIALCVPFVYYLFGKQAMGALYLFSACLNLAFYWGAGRGVARSGRHLGTCLAVIGAALVFPLFIQLRSGIFNSPELIFDPKGNIGLLPIPISVIAVFAGIALLGNYATATRTLTTVFFTAVMLVMTSLLVTAGNVSHEGAKLMLLAQFLLPLFGMVLGEMYGTASPENTFQRAAAVILLLVLPAQLISTWAKGSMIAQPDVYLFSIYQHLQYFPMVVTALAIMSTMALWGDGRTWQRAIAVLWSLVLIQLVASVSIAATAAGVLGVILFAFWHVRTSSGRPKVVAVALVALLLACVYGIIWQSDMGAHLMPGSSSQFRWTHKFLFYEQTQETVATHSRAFYWSEFARGSTTSVPTFLLGHAVPPDRHVLPSAHNYWLDVIYNFGALSALPLILLIALTVRTAWARRKTILADSALTATSAAFVYLLLENMLKVGMRQPYPGLITFFILGLLIARLRAVPRDAHAR